MYVKAVNALNQNINTVTLHLKTGIMKPEVLLRC
jgi:hypothetical protein